MTLSNMMQVESMPLDQVKDYPNPFNKPSKKQKYKTSRLIDFCGCVPVPIGIDGQNQVIVGQHFVTAAREKGFKTIAVIRFSSYMNEAQIKTLQLAYDRIAAEIKLDKCAARSMSRVYC